jgi:hypothetical protein
VHVRLIKKLAGIIDGVDLRLHEPGDVFDLKPSEAELLVAEGWAVAALPRSLSEYRGRQQVSVRTILAADRRK